MSDFGKTWEKITLPLTFLDKIALAILAGIAVFESLTWAFEPSWAGALGTFSSMAMLAIFWRWFWVEGYRRMFHTITAMGYNVGKDLNQYGDLLISKDGDYYKVTPLTIN